ncbi:MAG: hypothetical protein AAGC96_17965 [Pseudomonadota bacterium]
MFIHRITPIIAALSLISGCASQPGAVTASYVSPTVYASSSCQQITEERARIAEKVAEVAGEQQKKATGDAVAVGVGVVVFWPALFLLAAGKDKEAELASLKGNYDALNAAGVQKGCFTAESVQPPPGPTRTPSTNNQTDDTTT